MQYFLTESFSSQRVTFNLFSWSKQKLLFWRAGFYPANHSNLKSFQYALIGWKNVGPPKMPLLCWIWSCKQANSHKILLIPHTVTYLLILKKLKFSKQNVLNVAQFCDYKNFKIIHCNNKMNFTTDKCKI